MSTVKEPSLERTAYPHIIKAEGICDGEAVIEGTRIAVWHIVGYYYEAGMSVEEMLTHWKHLTPAQLFAALAYYHDNREEIDQARYENSYEYWKAHYGRLVPQSAETVSQ